MRYMMMVYDSEAASAEMTQEEAMQQIQDFMAFHQWLAEDGRGTFAERLHPTSTATTIRVREGNTLTVDGPFAETKEQLGGIYVFDCEDLDAAIEIAQRIPAAKTGSIEIRPIFEPPAEMQ